MHTDFLRIVLEVINVILAGNLAANPELVYALLHRLEVFTPLHAHPRCTELLDNIFAITDFFNAKARVGRLVALPPHPTLVCNSACLSFSSLLEHLQSNTAHMMYDDRSPPNSVRWLVRTAAY